MIVILKKVKYERVEECHGQWSSKRAMGVLYMLSGLLIFMYKEFHDKKITNPEILIGMVATGAGLLGLAIFEYFSKFKSNENK